MTPTETGESSSLKKVISCGFLSSNTENAVLLRPDTYRPYVSVTVTVSVIKSVLVISPVLSSSSSPSFFGGGDGVWTAAPGAGFSAVGFSWLLATNANASSASRREDNDNRVTLRVGKASHPRLLCSFRF